MSARLRRRDDSGAAAVEFALLLPILLIVVFGIVDFGRAYNMQIALSQGAREGARPLALGQGTAVATSRTKQAAYPIPSGSITVTFPTTCANPPVANSYGTVQAQTTFVYATPISGIFNILGLSSLAAPVITGKGEMRCGG